MVARQPDAGNVNLENEQIAHLSIGLEKILPNMRGSA
jgi:hypothetical protein